MTDRTETIRREMVSDINHSIESDNKDAERIRLESEHGQVWDTVELSADFTVQGFMAPFIVCIEKKTDIKGTMMFQHNPRFYFGWAVV